MVRWFRPAIVLAFPGCLDFSRRGPRRYSAGILTALGRLDSFALTDPGCPDSFGRRFRPANVLSVLGRRFTIGRGVSNSSDGQVDPS